MAYIAVSLLGAHGGHICAALSPTDGAQLAEQLRAGINGRGNDDDTELWEIATTLLRDAPASPELRKARWQIAATIPGVALIGPVTDAAGREGVAVELDMTGDGWLRERLIFDPADGSPTGSVDLKAARSDLDGHAEPVPEELRLRRWRLTTPAPSPEGLVTCGYVGSRALRCWC